MSRAELINNIRRYKYYNVENLCRYAKVTEFYWRRFTFGRKDSRYVIVCVSFFETSIMSTKILCLKNQHILHIWVNSSNNILFKFYIWYFCKGLKRKSQLTVILFLLILAVTKRMRGSDSEVYPSIPIDRLPLLGFVGGNSNLDRNIGTVYCR